jgi:hypothetical protein
MGLLRRLRLCGGDGARFGLQLLNNTSLHHTDSKGQATDTDYVLDPELNRAVIETRTRVLPDQRPFLKGAVSVQVGHPDDALFSVPIGYSEAQLPSTVSSLRFGARGTNQIYRKSGWTSSTPTSRLQSVPVRKEPFKVSKISPRYRKSSISFANSPEPGHNFSKGREPSATFDVLFISCISGTPSSANSTPVTTSPSCAFRYASAA